MYKEPIANCQPVIDCDLAIAVVSVSIYSRQCSRFSRYRPTSHHKC